MQPFEKRALVVTASCHWLVHVMEVAFAALLVNIAAEFGASLFTMGILANILGFTFGLSSLPVGFLADRFDERRLLAVCSAGMAVSAVVIGFAPSVLVLGGGLLMLGLSLGLYHPPSLRYIARIMARRGLGFGWLGVGGNLGTALGPLIVGVIAGSLGWRVPYFVLAVPALILTALFLLSERDNPEAGNETQMQPVRQDGVAVKPNPARLYVAAIVLVLIAQILNGFVYRGAITFLPMHLGQSLQFEIAGLGSVVIAGLFTTVALLFGVAGQWLGGWLSERRRPEALAVAAALGGAPMLALMGMTTGPALLFAAIGFAFFYFMSQPVYNVLVAEYSPGAWRGRIYGLSFFFGFGMGSFAASGMGFVADTAGVHWVFLACAGFALLALGFATTLLVMRLKAARFSQPG